MSRPYLWVGIEVEDENQPWAAAGSNVTIYLTLIDPAHVNIGTVLCPLTDIVPLATVFTAQIIVFDIQVPITAGTSVSRAPTLHLIEADTANRWSYFINLGTYLRQFRGS
jgi:translation elongation factor EF-1alpha